MVYKVQNVRSEFLFDGGMPDENIAYSRKGGCFISIYKGILILILLGTIIVVFGVVMFFTAKNIYEFKHQATLDEFISDATPLIQKTTEWNYLVPKHYTLFIHPVFNETYNINNNKNDDNNINNNEDNNNNNNNNNNEENNNMYDKKFSFVGTAMITVASKRSNWKRIDLNVKNLYIQASDVVVYKSHKVWKDYLRTTKLIRRRRDLDDNIDDNNNYSDNDDNLLFINNNTSNNNNTNYELNLDNDNIDNNIDDNITIIDNKNYNYDNKQSPIDIIKNMAKDYRMKYFEDMIPIKIEQIDFDDKNEKMFITLDIDLKRDYVYILKIFFIGNMTNDKGLFYTEYDSEDKDIVEKRYVAATVTDSNQADYIFPFLENKSVRMPFDFRIIRREHENTIFMSHLKKSEPIERDLMVDTYWQTPPITISEFGFGITNIKPFYLYTSPNLTINIYAKDALLRTELITFIPEINTFYENYTGIEYIADKLNYISLPRVSKLKTIKPGLIVTSEINSLNEIGDEAKHIEIFREELAYDVAKEWIERDINSIKINQQWVLDSLPKILQYVFIQKMETSTARLQEIIFENRGLAMDYDLYYEEFILSNYSKGLSFDESYYILQESKGFSIISMFNNSLNPSTLHNTIKNIFENRVNNTAADFYKLLKEFGNNETLGCCKENPIVSWANQNDYPIVNVFTNKSTGNIYLEQREFSFEKNPDIEKLWNIPISFTNNSVKDFSTDVHLWFRSNNLTVENAFNPDNNSWILLNSLGNGYFRVNYDESNWKSLITALEDDHEQFPIVTRSTIVDDAFSLAQVGLINYTIPFKILTCMKSHEKFYLPWMVALRNVEFLFENCDDLHNSLKIVNYVRETVNNVYQRLKQIKDIDQNEKYRTLILFRKWACKLGIRTCIEEARRDFWDLVKDNKLTDSKKPLDEIHTIMCTAMRHGDYEEWNLFKDFITTILYDENEEYLGMLIRALGCTSNPHLISLYLNFLLEDDQMWRKFSPDILTSIGNNKIALKYGLEFLRKNWIRIMKIIKIDQLSFMLKKISTDRDLQVFQEIYKLYPQTFSTEYKNIVAYIIHCVKLKLKWRHEIGSFINIQ